MYSIEDLFFDIFLFFAFGTVVLKILDAFNIYTAESLLLQTVFFTIIIIPIFVRHAFKKSDSEDDGEGNNV